MCSPTAENDNNSYLRNATANGGGDGHVTHNIRVTQTVPTTFFLFSVGQSNVFNGSAQSLTTL